MIEKLVNSVGLHVELGRECVGGLSHAV